MHFSSSSGLDVDVAVVAVDGSWTTLGLLWAWVLGWFLGDLGLWGRVGWEGGGRIWGTPTTAAAGPRTTTGPTTPPAGPPTAPAGPTTTTAAAVLWDVHT